jgi:MerR family transcriptional regulator, redox-sensitive transcriptional activator SoxR
MLKVKVDFKSSAFCAFALGRNAESAETHNAGHPEIACVRRQSEGSQLVDGTDRRQVQRQQVPTRRHPMKIGELARRAGLNASAIRYYEKMGLLAPPQRLSSQRRYPSDALDRVLLIRFASEMDFTLDEIKLFLNGLRDNAPVGSRWKKLAAKKLTEVEDHIARSLRLKTLLQCLLHCHCASLKQCVTALGLSESLRIVAKRPR